MNATKPNLSEYQKNALRFFDDSLGSGSHAMIEAVAGSGKTSLGVWMFERLPKNLYAEFVTFNKHIQIEAQEKLKGNGKASTYHSLGLRIFRGEYPRFQLLTNTSKAQFLLGKSVEKKFIFYSVDKLVSLLKAGLYHPDDVDYSLLYRLSLAYDVNLYEDKDWTIKESILQTTIKAFQMSYNERYYIDFDDMIYFPVILGMKSNEPLDFIFADEFQDTNYAQGELILSSIADTGTIIGVGDSHQSIYAFRGADSQAMKRLGDRLNAIRLPLSISYRCPQKIRELVNNKFPKIPFETPDWAVPGNINNITQSDLVKQAKDGDMILCRVNADLVSLAFTMIQEGKPARVRGKDLSKGLVAIAKKIPAHTMKDWYSKLTQHEDETIRKFIDNDLNDKIEYFKDQMDTLRAIAKGCQSPNDIVPTCESLFTEDRDGIILSSIHKAKGLEADTVSIIRPDLLPHPRTVGSGDEAEQQERNVEYVAITRTKNELNFVT